MCLSFKCYCLCLTECTFIKVLKINTQTNIHCGSVTPTFYDSKIMGSLCSWTAFWWHRLRECPPGSGSFSPTYWDNRPQDCHGAGVPSEGVFHLIYMEPPLLPPFFWPVPFFHHPSFNVCLLKDLSPKGITFSPERRLLIEKILCSLSLSWLFWGMFLIHDAGRREPYPVKAQFSGMWDKSPLLQRGASLDPEVNCHFWLGGWCGL